jgi:hypothetical protein
MTDQRDTNGVKDGPKSSQVRISNPRGEEWYKVDPESVQGA